MSVLDKPQYQELKEFLQKFEASDDTLYYFAYNTNQLFSHLRHIVKTDNHDDVREIDAKHITPLLNKLLKKFEDNGEYRTLIAEIGTIYQNIPAPLGGKFWEVEAFQSISIASNRIKYLNKVFSWFSYENIKLQLEDILTNDKIKFHKEFINRLVYLTLRELTSMETYKKGINDLRKLKGPEGRAGELRQTTSFNGYEHTAQGYYLMMRTAVRMFKDSEVKRVMDEVTDQIYETGSTSFGSTSSEWLLCAFDLGYEYFNKDWTSAVYISARISLAHKKLKMTNVIDILSKGRKGIWLFQDSNPEVGLKLENYFNNSACGYRSEFDNELTQLAQEADIIIRQGKTSNLLIDLDGRLITLYQQTPVQDKDEYAYVKSIVPKVLIKCAYLKKVPSIKTYKLLHELFAKEKSLENSYGKVFNVKRATPRDKRENSSYGKWLYSRINNKEISDLEYMAALYANTFFLSE